MSDLRKAIWQHIVNDNLLSYDPPYGLGFKVFDRWLTELGPGSTPEAFRAPGTLHRSAVIMPADEVASPARRPGYDRMRVLSNPIIYLFAEKHANGHDAIDAAYRRIVILCHGKEFVLPSGERPLVQLTDGRTGARDDESYPGNLRSEVRVTANWGRKLG